MFRILFISIFFLSGAIGIERGGEVFSLYAQSGQNKIKKQGKTYSYGAVKKGQIRYCLRYRDQLYDFYIEGTIYAFKKSVNKFQAIAKVEGGCFLITEAFCKQLDKVVFRPKKLKAFKYNYRFRLPKRSGRCYFKQQPTNHLNMDYRTFKEMQDLSLSIPYANNIVLQNTTLRNQIIPQVEKCGVFSGAAKTTCKINESYNYVVSRFRYILDDYDPFSEKDLIYSPQQTIRRGGGDCEDLTGLLLSYLANQNIESYLMLTDDHAYGMACGVDSATLQTLINRKFDTVKVEEKEMTLKEGGIATFGLNANKSLPVNIAIEIKATKPVNLYRLANRRQLRKLQYRQPFNYQDACSRQNTTRVSLKCSTELSGMTVVEYPQSKNNKRQPPIKFKIRISYHYNTLQLQNDISVRYYLVNNNKCVVLEPTAGKNGYPGYSVDTAQRKLAINPRNGKWFYLK